MDPLDHLRALPDGPRCSVCDERVPTERVKVLAWRDDLCFLQLDCRGCLSSTLGFMMGGRTEDASAPPSLPPVSADDVLDMHELLATWRGDLTGLLRSDARTPVEPGR